MLSAVGCLFWASGAARAEDASSWRDIETKYIFGFTTGSGIGLEGEKEFTVDSIGRFGKRDGHYAATETKFEFEFTPTQFIQIEFGALGSTHTIGGVTDLELLKNRLFAGFNLLYEPEITQTLAGDTEREAKFGGSAALSLRIASNVVVGGEVWYLRHYDAANLTAFTGDAVLLGPTLYVQFTPKMFMTAAWNTQVWGREVGNPVSLNLAEFQRNRARLKFAVEF